MANSISQIMQGVVKRVTAIILFYILSGILINVEVETFATNINLPIAIQEQECRIAAEPCADTLQDCLDTASENYEDGTHSAEQYVMFAVVYCPAGFLDCVEDRYGDDGDN